MKKTLLVSTFALTSLSLLGFGVPAKIDLAKAESPTSDVSVPFSKGTTSLFFGIGINNTSTKQIKAIGEGGGRAFGPVQFGYQYHLSNRFCLGLMYTYTSAETGEEFVTDFITQANYTYKFNISTFLSRLDYCWMNKKNFAYYSGFGFGTQKVTASTSVASGDPSLVPDYTEDFSGVAGHLTIFGFKARFGNNGKLGMYSEVGFGVNGLWNAGLTYSF
jgi:hypothetical protein